MFGFLGFIFIFILFIVLIALILLGNLIRAIFGLGRRAPKHYGQSYSSTPNNPTPSTNGKKKIFTESEGEYVEFEEVK